MINKKNLIEDILQNENVLADANYYYKEGYDARQREILNIIERQSVVDTEGIDAAYLQLAKENAELKKQLAAVNKFMENEPRFMLDKESICYGCQYFKKVEDCGGIPAVDDIISGGACDCANPCFEGSQNDYGLEVEV